MPQNHDTTAMNLLPDNGLPRASGDRESDRGCPNSLRSIETVYNCFLINKTNVSYDRFQSDTSS